MQSHLDSVDGIKYNYGQNGSRSCFGVKLDADFPEAGLKRSFKTPYIYKKLVLY